MDENIQFDIDTPLDRRPSPQVKPQGLAGLLIHTGIVKNEFQASVVLVVFAVILLGISVVIFSQELFFNQPSLSQEDLNKVYELTPDSL